MSLGGATSRHRKGRRDTAAPTPEAPRPGTPDDAGTLGEEATSHALVRLYHVSKSYLPGAYALRDVNLSIGKGELVFLTGPSGAGKTTLLRLLFAAEKPSEGSIIIGGRLSESAVPSLRRRIGVVFQDFKLLPRRSVEENVGLTLAVRGEPPRQVRSRAFRMLKQVGLQHRRHHAPLSLSGGEQQRVAIARALVGEPELLLADEPTGNLDPELTLEIMDLIAAAAARGTTVVVATHDHTLVERYARRRRRSDP